MGAVSRDNADHRLYASHGHRQITGALNTHGIHPAAHQLCAVWLAAFDVEGGDGEQGGGRGITPRAKATGNFTTSLTKTDQA
jgi:hypothetical protein